MSLFTKKVAPKRTVAQAVSAFTSEFEEIQKDQELVSAEAKLERERIMKEAQEQAAIQSEIESTAALEADKAKGAIQKFNDFFGV